MRKALHLKVQMILLRRMLSMLLSFALGCLGAPIDEIGVDLDGDGVIDEVVEVDCSSDLNSDLVEVDGYYRADGTWVDSYVRTAPDTSVTNNLGFWDLINA